MKKKTLTEEVNRMLILMESPANKWVVAAEGLVKVLKETPGFSKLRYIRNLEDAVTPEDVIKVLNEMAIYSRELKKVVLEHVYKNLNSEVTNTVSELIEASKNGLDAGRPMDEINKLMEEMDYKLNEIKDILVMIESQENKDILNKLNEF